MEVGRSIGQPTERKRSVETGTTQETDNMERRRRNEELQDECKVLFESVGVRGRKSLETGTRGLRDPSLTLEEKTTRE